MIKRAHIFLIFALLIFFVSCEKSEKIDDFPLFPSKLVVNCYFTEGDTFAFQVSKSLSVLDNADLKLLSGAKVKLFGNGVVLDSTSVQREDGWYELPGRLARKGVDYSIEVTASGFNTTLRATDRLPDAVPIDSVTVSIADSAFEIDPDPYGGYYTYGYLRGSFYITFQDPPDDENYYGIGAFYFDTVYSGENQNEYTLQKFHLSLTSDDPAIDEALRNNYGNIYLSDQFINGKRYTLKADFEDYRALRNRNYVIEFVSLSKAAFLYKQTIQEYLHANGDPFAEPVQIFTNIENGYGIFAGMSSDTAGVKITY